MKKFYLFLIIVIVSIVAGCKNRTDENILKVMTFNIRYDNPTDSFNAWTYRKSLITKFINSEKPDLVGMQEVLLNQFAYLDSMMTEYTQIGVGRNDGTKSGEMNPVFFRKERFELIRTKTFWLSETPEIPGSKSWESSLPRIVTWVELSEKTSHEHFYFFNTHFAHDSDSARVMSSYLLLNMVDSIASGFPFIITGDFNMLLSSRSYAILTGPYESVPLLSDSYAISEKRPVGPAYTFNGFSENRRSGRIDYIFVRAGLKVLELKTFIRKEHGIYISDHWPVQALIQLK